MTTRAATSRRTGTTTTAPSATAPLTVKKLRTSEDDDSQRVLARLAAIDQKVAAGIVIEGAFNDLNQWPRLMEFLDDEVPCETLDVLEDTLTEAIRDRIEASYLAGVAVGLRLARLDAKISEGAR